MEKLIWLLTFFHARVLFVSISIVNAVLLADLHQKGILQESILSNSYFALIVGTISVVVCIVSAIVGGKIGYNYVEMFRSKFWHYHSTKYSDINSKARNVIYWACKFACITLIFIEFLLLLLILSWYYKRNLLI